MAAAVFLTACQPKEEVRVYENTAAQDAVGVYTGQWTSVSSSSGNETLYNGEFELAVYQDSLANQCLIYIRSTEPNPAWNYRGLTNVTHAGDDIIFNNDRASGNGVGAQFYGRIHGDGTATMFFSSTGREGRKNVIFSNSFVGQKQAQQEQE